MTANPLQELAEKIRLSRGIAGWDQGSQYESILLELLAASLGTLLQAERAAQRELDAQIPDRWANSKSCEPGQVCTHQRMGAEIAYLIRKATTPEAASALSAVVQRETAKLREHLKWAMEQVGNRMDGIYRSKGETYDCHYICPGCSAESTIKEFQHRPDCEYAAALAALQ